MIAISTAFNRALIAIDINGEKDFKSVDGKFRQSENLLMTIDEILQKNCLQISDNDAYAVVIGPGSFTGLRVGLATIKGLCAGSKKPCQVVAISSFDLMARQHMKNKPKSDFVCAINALSDLVFVCEYGKNGEKMGSERVITRREFDDMTLDKVGLSEENICLNGVELLPQTLLEIANEYIDGGKTVDIHLLSPMYLHKSQAEDNLEGRKKG